MKKIDFVTLRADHVINLVKYVAYKNYKLKLFFSKGWLYKIEEESSKF